MGPRPGIAFAKVVNADLPKDPAAQERLQQIRQLLGDPSA